MFCVITKGVAVSRLSTWFQDFWLCHVTFSYLKDSFLCYSLETAWIPFITWFINSSVSLMQFFPSLRCQKAPSPTDMYVPGPSSCASRDFWVKSVLPGSSPEWAPYPAPHKFRLVVFIQATKRCSPKESVSVFTFLFLLSFSIVFFSYSRCT